VLVKVLVDALVTATGAAGIGAYAEGLVGALGASAGVEVVVVGVAGRGSRVAGVERVAVEPGAGLAARSLWRERHLARIVREHRADAVLAVNPELPLRRLPVPALVVVHDVFPLTSPRLTGRAKQLRFRLTLPAVCARASHVVCVSEATRDALARSLRVPGEKLRVIGEGPSPLPVLARAPAEPPRLLYVGELYKRKNLHTLLAALRESGLHLDMVGPARERALAALHAQLDAWGLRDRVVHHGFVSDEGLARLYARAAALVLPSLEEGFGRPLLDAMTLGVPAVASDIPALRELAGGGALLVRDPLDPAEWGGAIERALGDSGLAERGRRRAVAYSWPEVARQFAQLLR
jgi:glycosyltransferase involved in cell wall biosynthesis